MYYLDSSHVWHVAKSGNDNNSGHAGQYPVNLANNAKLTIGAAVNAATNGDTIIIWPGTYDEALDLDAANKSLVLIGTNREKCIIHNSTGGGNGIKLEDGCELYNLSLWSGTGNGASGIVAQSKSNITIDTVYAKSNSVTDSTDGAQFNSTKDLVVRNSIFTGPYDGCVISSAERAKFDSCSFITTAEYAGEVCGLKTGSAARAVFHNCSFHAYRSADIDYKVYGALAKGQCIFIGCTFYAKTAMSCDADAVALSADGGSFIGCSFYAYPKTGFTGYDIEGTGTGPVLISCTYLTGNLTGSYRVIDRGVDIDSAGRVDVGAIKDVDADALITAIKLLKNKAVQNKLTGEIKYYDDDGETIILTHTPTDSESTIERMPS
ncbi:MAG: hypothetical protein MUP16_02160 [Sedimentisphaerales bacterium]|nr:hypothetical protein [Sedimentisphaerales bacterium]